MVPEEALRSKEFAGLEEEPDDDPVPTQAMSFAAVARQAALDRDDGLGL
jgi:hypothetical protein